MPDLPPDWALPMQEILLHTACELQSSLRIMAAADDQSSFNPRDWLITVTLNPKVDADIQPGAGLVRRNPATVGAKRFGSLVLGSGTGITADFRGQRTGSVDFSFDSSKLIDDKALHCDRESSSYHSLTQTLGIADWFDRAVAASRASSSKMQNPKFSAQVFIKFGGGNSYTYNMPMGNNLLSLSGYYQLDENLNIVFSSKPKVAEIFQVTTLPGVPKQIAPNSARVPAQATITVLEQQELSLQQIRQQLQNFRTLSQ